MSVSPCGPPKPTGKAATAALAIESRPDSTVPENPQVIPEIVEPAPSVDVAPQVEPQTVEPAESSAPTLPPVSPPANSSPAPAISPGFGGGGGGSSSVVQQNSSPEPEAPASAVLTVASPADNSYVTCTSVAVSGTAD